MQLKLGIMSNKELADWFGISQGYFSREKNKKLEELKLFAKFEEIGNKTKKIKILEIYEPVYSKKGSENFQEIYNSIDEAWNKDGLDSCRRVSEAIMEKKQLPIAQSTAERYTAKGRNLLYGKPFEYSGTLGRCTYVLCKKEGEGIQTHYARFTPEEEEIKKKLIQKYFGDVSEKTIIVQGMVQMGEIKKEEAWDVLQQLTSLRGNNFLMFLAQLQSIVHCQVVKATDVERFYIESAF